MATHYYQSFCAFLETSVRTSMKIAASMVLFQTETLDDIQGTTFSQGGRDLSWLCISCGLRSISDFDVLSE